MGNRFSRQHIHFNVFVHTGDKPNSGSDATVSIILYDEEGNASNTINLDNKFSDDFERGQVDTFTISDKETESLQKHGKISRISIWRDNFGIASGWYVDKIVIENRFSNEYFVFPIFRWIKSDYKYQICHLDTALPQEDKFIEQRKMELEEKRKKYEFWQNVKNGPAQVKDMPSDEQFSFDYKWDILTLKAKLIAKSFCIKFKLKKGEFGDLGTLSGVYSGKTFHKPKGVDRWRNDRYFGLQRVASLNHSLIELVTEIPEKFPLTDELVKPLLEGHTLAEAIEEKRLFMCDLKILEGIECKEPYVLCVPMAMFYLDKNNQIGPIAIQLFQTPAEDNPIFTPLDKPLLWAYVKMWYNNADAAYHQALTHLGLTHLLMEGVCVATHRNLSQSHPVFKVLAPHFLYLIAINTRGLELLVSENGWVDKTMNYGRDGLFEVINRGINSWRMNVEGTLPEDLKNRGLDDLNVLPCYHFRNDAILLYDAIKKYVRAYVDLYYPTRDLLKGDTEVQGWVAELVKERNYSEGGVGVKGVPGNGELNNTEELVLIITSIIFTCSISHASTNFPQYEEYAFPPNYPGLMRSTPPKTKDIDITDKDIIASIPDKPTTLDIMTVTKILSDRGTKSIGDFEVQYVFDPKAMEIVTQFREDLNAISKEIKARNGSRDPPYEYLDPKIIPNSISI